ncbi:claudin-20 [Artibeus jamaicensis]|uniref:claudin-20 n=1 Tax=Artibeus jamaicensis TaxID=9417 RepID=UPI00235AC4A7|nr:claudin-20 [Artibeus jamaicensis]XP_053524761.1 claudin-20 [Artibeus jamaicensis]XP_053524762.1 claudin-20 [Artibeus jamaicensis]XP_053524763.1 claudin-20 [Artibeus jamaicensis]
MGLARIQLLAFALAFCGVSGVLVATVLPNWKVTVDTGPNIITAIVQLQGLWMDCTCYSTGMFSCTLKYSILSLPTYVQAARAAMVLACVLSAVGICTSTVGMQCTRLGGDRETKSHTCFAGGVCLMSAGISGLIPTVWYTKEIITTFLDLTVPESNKHEPGGAVYVGFISAMLLLTSGTIFCTSCVKRDPEAWLSPPKQQRTPSTRPEGDSAYNLKDYV